MSRKIVLRLAALAFATAAVVSTPVVAQAAAYAPIVNHYNGKCLEVEDSNTYNGARIQLWQCVGQPGARWASGGPSGDTRYVGGVYWSTMKNTHSGKCLEVEDSAGHDGARVQLWDCVGQTGAYWRWFVSNGKTILVNLASRKCLEAEDSLSHNGTTVQQWSCVGQDGAYWY